MCNFGGVKGAATTRVETFLLRLTSGRPVVGRTPPVGMCAPMVFPASERAAQIQPTCVSWMSQKPNPAVGAVRHAWAQFGVRVQHRTERGLVLTHKPISAIVLVPILAKCKNFADRDTKEPGSRLGY